jgi:hypothetical protein
MQWVDFFIIFLDFLPWLYWGMVFNQKLGSPTPRGPYHSRFLAASKIQREGNVLHHLLTKVDTFLNNLEADLIQFAIIVDFSFLLVYYHHW